jgi:transcriptional regulator with XRE-family HTH domain
MAAGSRTLASVGKRNPASQKRRLQTALRDMRHDAGLSQAELARSLGRPQSFVSKYESGERRLDILELREVCNALGSTLTAFARRLERSLR